MTRTDKCFDVCTRLTAFRCPAEPILMVKRTKGSALAGRRSFMMTGVHTVLLLPGSSDSTNRPGSTASTGMAFYVPLGNWAWTKVPSAKHSGPTKKPPAHVVPVIPAHTYAHAAAP